MFGLGHWEVLVIVLVALLLFGKRIPTIARAVGRSVVDFKHGLHEGEGRG